jgi:hypothetical protein
VIGEVVKFAPQPVIARAASVREASELRGHFMGSRAFFLGRMNRKFKKNTKNTDTLPVSDKRAPKYADS